MGNFIEIEMFFFRCCQGIQKEKEALEASLKALAEAKNSAESDLTSCTQDSEKINQSSTDGSQPSNSEGISKNIEV